MKTKYIILTDIMYPFLVVDTKEECEAMVYYLNKVVVPHVREHENRNEDNILLSFNVEDLPEAPQKDKIISMCNQEVDVIWRAVWSLHQNRDTKRWQILLPSEGSFAAWQPVYE